MTETLAYEGVTFRYRRRAAPVVQAFTWQVPAGKTVLLGPNGAGKTTLLALGADALRGQQGIVRIGALESRRWRDRAPFRKSVGWMPQSIRAVPGLTAREQIAYSAWLKGVSAKEAWRRSMRSLEQVDMVASANTLTSRLSGGQLRRIGLAQTFVYPARILLLDEPTVGLDPGQRAAFREILQSQIPDDQRTVVSTHEVDDLSDLYETVVVLAKGRIRFQGSVSEFLLHASPQSRRPAESAYQAITVSDE